MARTQKNAQANDRRSDEQSLDLALSRLAGDRFDTPMRVTLALDDMLQDEGGEVVLYNDSGLRSMELADNPPVLSQGVSDQHVTAGGEDVTGFRFVTFEGGMTLYYQEGLELILQNG